MDCSRQDCVGTRGGTRRAARRRRTVKQEHVGSLGSIETPPSVAARVAFWHGMHGRLAKLSNRIKADDHEKILGALDAKIPMPMLDNQHALKRTNAESNEQFWSRLHDMHAGTVEEQKGLAALVAGVIAQEQASMTAAAAAARIRLPNAKVHAVLHAIVEAQLRLRTKRPRVARRNA